MPKMKTTAEDRESMRANSSLRGVAVPGAYVRWLIDDLEAILAENAKLRAEIEGWRVGVQVAQDILDTRAVLRGTWTTRGEDDE